MVRKNLIAVLGIMLLSGIRSYGATTVTVAGTSTGAISVHSLTVTLTSTIAVGHIAVLVGATGSDPSVNFVSCSDSTGANTWSMDKSAWRSNTYSGTVVCSSVLGTQILGTTGTVTLVMGGGVINIDAIVLDVTPSANPKAVEQTNTGNYYSQNPVIAASGALANTDVVIGAFVYQGSSDLWSSWTGCTNLDHHRNTSQKAMAVCWTEGASSSTPSFTAALTSATGGSAVIVPFLEAGGGGGGPGGGGGGGGAGTNSVYYALTAQGTGTGASCTNALAYNDATKGFNAAANWTSGTPAGTQIGPGTVVHLCGTFTGTTNTTLLTFQGSGSSGSVVTLYFEAGTQLNSAAWAANGAININSKNYILIDGGTNGIIQNTANGSVLANQQASSLIGQPSVGGHGPHDVEVKNLKLLNTYVHVANSSDSAPVNASAAIQILGAESNWLVHDNTIADCGGGCVVLAGNSYGSTNWKVYNNDVSQARWEIDLNNVSGQSHGIFVYGNTIHDNDKYWDDANTYHANEIFLYGNPASSPTSGTYGQAYIYNNTITGALSFATGFIFLSKQMDAPVYIFNNVFRPTSAYSKNLNASCAASWVSMVWNLISSVGVYNNTFDASIACGKISGPTSKPVTISNAVPLDFRNNIMYDVQGMSYATIDHAASVSNSDYNIWYNIANYGTIAFDVAYGGDYMSWAATCPAWTASPATNANCATTVASATLSEVGTTVTATGNFGYHIGVGMPVIVSGAGGYNCSNCTVASKTSNPVTSITYVGPLAGIDPGLGSVQVLRDPRAGAMDAHSLTTNPLLSATDQIGAGSPAIGLGANLTSICNSDANLAPLCLDKSGASRSAVGAWDAGAYNYVDPGACQLSMAPGINLSSVLVGSDQITTNISNVGTAQCSGVSISTSGLFGYSTTCGSTIAVGASCAITIWSSGRQTNTSGALSIFSNDPLSPAYIPITAGVVGARVF